METKILLGFGATAVIVLGAAVAYAAFRRPRNRTVLCIGDSLTAHGGYCNELEALLGEGSRVYCKGYSGQGTRVIRDHLRDSLKQRQYTDVVILAGVNDLASGRKVSNIIDNLTDMYDAAAATGARVIAVQLTPWGNHSRFDVWDMNELNDWIRYGAPATTSVDTSRLGDWDGVLQPAFDSGDGLHLNNQGQAALGELIYRQGF